MTEITMTATDIRLGKQDANQLAKILYDKVNLAVCVSMRDHGAPVPADLFARYEIAQRDLHNTAVAWAMEADLLDVVHTADFDLTVTHVHYATGTPVADVLDGSAVAEMVILTQDGRRADYQTWYDGGDADGREWVYYERYTAAGRVGHGWIDAVHRTLVQSG